MLDAVHHMKLGIDVFQVGRVLSVSDGICWMDGLADIMYGELVEFVNGERGMVMDIQADRVGCIIFGRYDHVDSYSRVRPSEQDGKRAVGEAMLGRVVDALGKPIDGPGPHLEHRDPAHRIPGARHSRPAVGLRAAAHRHQGDRRTRAHRPRPA